MKNSKRLRKMVSDCDISWTLNIFFGLGWYCLQHLISACPFSSDASVTGFFERFTLSWTDLNRGVTLDPEQTILPEICRKVPV